MSNLENFAQCIYRRIPNGNTSSISRLLSRFGTRGREVKDEEAYIVLLTEFLAQRSAHDDTALAGGSLEVRLARLSARRGEG